MVITLVSVATKPEQCQLSIEAKGPLLRSALALLKENEMLALFQVAYVSISAGTLPPSRDTPEANMLSDKLSNGEGIPLILFIGFTLVVTLSPKHRCPRCWLHRADVFASPCIRCAEALENK
ncbi:hypothetical protein DI09_140p30 [Mitosporidium daphniae]|uniref:Uncharacterized protein n=1 Tax=Mitosporidium daphniae TaxID=1485682 RepID=A0A098VU98_9MICR|nr:uncharacterized protein DI09_140p30 [Mitosporidium daphniae]KGG52708.1 hypothetical protein DI09_140p30 [Mitosporidium daphniae]|eukprot:XP_013239144.1 uncharacterized protein DI09_140p30 [Mitosporidium daphniae]